MNKLKIAYWIFTGLLSLNMLFSAGMYLFNYEMVEGFFQAFGYPTYVIYPLAIAKILGITAILTKKSEFLKQWAYAGFFFDIVLAIGAHVSINDGGEGGAIGAMIFLLGSVILDKKVFAKRSERVAEVA